MEGYVIPLLLTTLISLVGFFGGLLLNSLRKSVDATADRQEASCAKINDVHTADKKELVGYIDRVKDLVTEVVNKSSKEDAKIREELISHADSLKNEIFAQTETFTSETRKRVEELYGEINPLRDKVLRTEERLGSLAVDLGRISTQLNRIEEEIKSTDKNIDRTVKDGIAAGMGAIQSYLEKTMPNKES